MELNQVIEQELENIENQQVEVIEKKKRGRPKGSKNKPKLEQNQEPVREQSEQTIIPISSLVNILLDRLNLTLLSPIESETLDLNFTKVFNKYIDFNYSEEVNLGLVLLIIISSRYKEYKENIEKVNENKTS